MEKNESFRPYIEILPIDMGVFPINFTSEELNMLQGCEILHSIETENKCLESDFENILKIIPDFRYTL